MSNHNPLTLKLNLREKIAYGMGDVGSNLMLSIGTLYLLKFYTDELGMPAYYGGIIFLYALRTVFQHDELLVWRDDPGHYQKPE